MSRASARSRRVQAHGFTYLGALLLVAVLGLGLAATGQVWHTRTQRAREADLLWVGAHYRRAIERYYRNGPSQYPRSLEDLLQDPRKQNLERYLRTLYFDPMRVSARWGTVKAPDGGIMGVYSLAEGHPFKTAGFTEADADFKDATTYRDWKFVFQPPEQPTPQPGGAGG
ncbi:MAG: type II secretion system protein [Burkholderiales bacterium]